MPRIQAANIEKHHEKVWQDLAEAMGQLLVERDYASINMGHIAARAGLARNTLYNYARDKTSLTAALVQRASSPTIERLGAIVARKTEPADARMREFIAVLLAATTNRTMQLMLQPGPEQHLRSQVLEAPGGQFKIIAAGVESIVHDGIENGEFRDIDDVPLTVALLAGIVRSGADRIARDPDSLPAVTNEAQKIVLTVLTHRPGLSTTR
jgi:AcrR family transcriptional regulator